MVYGRFFYAVEIVDLSHGTSDGAVIFERARKNPAGSRCSRIFGTVLFLCSGMADPGTGRSDRHLADPVVLLSPISLLWVFFLDPVSVSLEDVVGAGVEADLHTFTGNFIPRCFDRKVCEWVSFTAFFQIF